METRKTFHIHTYGCQMNVRDSEVLSNRLVAHGYVPAIDEDSADIIIVNSCSVRQKAEDKALGKIGLLSSTRRAKKATVGLVGCMAQRLGENIFKRVPGLAFSVGTRAEMLIPGILKRIEAGETHICETGVYDEEDRNHDDIYDLACLTDDTISQSATSFVTILLGCNRRCSYCIVPDVRGNEYSRHPDEIIEEVREAASAGVKDITLLGQSVMNYGRRNFVWPENIKSDMGFTEPLPRLFEYIVKKVPQISRIRFTSGHPSGVTDELIRAMRDIPQVCEHLHLPVQSGSDKVLKMMRRGYNSTEYLIAIKKLRDAISDIAITSDIIVGFPGETEKDFEDTRRVMEEAGFDNSYIFKYSPRPGTPAAELEDDVTEDEKKHRNQVLLEDQDKRGIRINRSWIGRDVEVLVEGASLRNINRWSGRTPQNKIVVFENTSNISVGDTVLIRITEVQPQTLYGTVVVS